VEFSFINNELLLLLYLRWSH